MLALPVLAGVLAPLLAAWEGQDPATFHTELLAPDGGAPLGDLGGVSADHWLGVAPVTGIDLFAQIVYGIRTSLFVALATTILATLLAAVIGAAMGLIGGWFAAVMGRLIDLFYSFPGLLTMIAVMIIVPDSFPRPLLMVLVLAFFGWPGNARVIAAETRAIAAQEFVDAARSTGAGVGQLLRREIGPNIAGLLTTMAVMSIPGYVSAVAGLSFLGVGMPEDVPDLGRLLADSLSWIYSGADVWYMIFPGATIMLIVLGATLIGDALGEALETRRSSAA